MPVKLVGLLLLFAFCTAWSVYELTRPQGRLPRVSNILHLLMAVVMLLMVVPATWHALTMVVPTPALAIFFALATVWFLVTSMMALRDGERARGLHLAGHGAMFAAMTWHLAAMAVMASAMASGMSGHDHGGGQMSMAAMKQPGGMLWNVALIGLPLMAYLLAATVAAVRKLFLPPGGVVDHTCHEPRPTGSRDYRLAAVGDAAMNGGMFWMSTGLLTPIVPFLAALSF